MGKIVFKEEYVHPKTENEEPWIVLISDDDEAVHAVTKMVLNHYEFEGRPVELMSAYSAKETIEVLRDKPNVALVLLDVVMESINAGLEAVPVIRDHVRNKNARIIIRTGQAGDKNHHDIIREYDINDFKEKSYLDHRTLIDTVTLSLRNYRDIIRREAAGTKADH